MTYKSDQEWERYGKAASARLFAYIPGSENDTNAQAKLGRMQGWTAAKLEAALPSWYKTHRAQWLTKPFKPDLRMHLPNPCTHLRDPRTAADFAGLEGLNAETYIKAWNNQHRYKQGAAL